MNTRFLEKEYDYVKPATLDEALDILAEKENVKVLAGGTDLIVKLKTDALEDMDIMMDINGIDELCGCCINADGDLVIGATAKISHLEKNDDIKAAYPALSEAMHAMASVSVRNMATMGGNFMNASPVADTAGPAMCYGAQVCLKSKKGERTIDATEFFLKPGVTAAEDDELLTGFVIPKPADNTGAAFVKIGRVKSDIAKVSITAVMEREGDTVKSCRLAMGSVAPKPLFLADIGAGLEGQKMTEELIMKTADQIRDFVKPIGDHGTTAEYRKEMSGLIARDCLMEAWKRSGGELA